MPAARFLGTRPQTQRRGGALWSPISVWFPLIGRPDFCRRLSETLASAGG